MRPRGATILHAALIALALAYVVLHVVTIYRESVNWDELALLRRAETAAKFDRIDGGGRPGLATLVLLPLVSGCSSTMDAVVHARWLWAGFTFALLAGAFVLVARSSRSPHRLHAAALGVAALALVPVFMRWSIHVRTDQPAAAAAIWGAVALVASRGRPHLAALGGGAFALGYLFSQKAIYLAGLGGLLALADLLVAGELAWKRELRRIAWLAGGAAFVVVAYTLIVPLFFVPAKTVELGKALDSFDYYRKTFGFRVYRGMLPTLYPQLVLALAIAVGFVVSARRGSEHRRPLLCALAVLAAGVVVGKFHAGAFPYFWITLGVFPAIAIGLAWPCLAALAGRAAIPIGVALWAWLLWIAVPYRHELLDDTQAIQRESFAFVERNFEPAARGFNADGGLFCRGDPDPFPVYLRETVDRRFHGEAGARERERFVAEFRTRPVAFIVESFLLEPFPAEVREFWAAHYVTYAARVAVAGRVIGGRAGAAIELDVLVAADYRWHGTRAIAIAGQRVEPGATIPLAAGRHPITLLEDTPEAMLALALRDPPASDRRPFHAVGPIVEILGMRARW